MVNSTEQPRRRKKASSPIVHGDSISTSSAPAPTNPGKELVIPEEEDSISSGQKFARPEETFPAWLEILETSRESFLQASAQIGPEAAKQSQYYNQMINKLVSQHPEWNVSQINMGSLIQLLRAYKFGYGPIEDYMRIPNVEEVYFNSYDNGFYIAEGKKHKIEDKIFNSEQDIINFVSRIANENNLEINLQKPILDAKLTDGSRLNAIIAPIAVSGADFTIRKHSNIPFTVEDFIRNGVFPKELAEDIKNWTRSDLNVIVSGGTASGKTTLLNVIGNYCIPSSDRVLILENSKELQIETEDTEYLETRVDPTNPEAEGNIYLSALVRAALRKRPDRIIVGEIRDSEAYEALKAWNSGHGGSFCTLHADSARAAISKLEQLVGEKGILDNQGVRLLISDAVDIIVQISRFKGTSQRKIVEVVQILHPQKHKDTPEIKELIKKLSESGQLRRYQDQLYYLPLYRLNRENQLQKVNNLIPLENKG